MRTQDPLEWKPRNAWRLRDDFPGAPAQVLRYRTAAPTRIGRTVSKIWREGLSIHRLKAQGSVEPTPRAAALRSRVPFPSARQPWGGWSAGASCLLQWRQFESDRLPSRIGPKRAFPNC